MSSLQPFTSNFKDNSTEAGFQFTFYCDLCREGFKTEFIECKSNRSGKLLKSVGGLVSAAAQMSRKHSVGYGLRRGTDVISERFRGMTPQWHKEHQVAFEVAQNEAKRHFQRCPKCRKWVCETDWNEQATLCSNCAPRENVEVAAARASKMVKDIQGKAQETEVFTGEIEGKQTLCPQCDKPAGEGKFCSNCGHNLSMLECERCGTQSPSGVRFCGECGNRLG